jgi:CRISPR/Cas system-associated protein endoribonuclease Cas2
MVPGWTISKTTLLSTFRKILLREGFFGSQAFGVEA